jgi:uncharacterized membrane protein YjfL (UPF0719 family)
MIETSVLELLWTLGEGVVFALVVFAFMWLTKQLGDVRSRAHYDADVEIEERANLALGLRRAGLYLGLAVGMTGALTGGGAGFQTDLMELVIEGAILSGLLVVALILTDRVVIHGIDNQHALSQGNVAVGLVELGVALATGLIALGSFSGEGGGVVSAVVFFGLGQLALIVLAIVYEKVTPYQVIEDVRDGNAAAGAMLGGVLVAFGFILSASLTGPSIGWVEDLTGFGISAVAGISLILLFQWPIDRLFLPGLSLQRAIEGERNVAAVVVAVAVKIAIALVIAAVMI